MRVAVIGLGGIAQKAYLPILATREDLELVLCTRNQATLAQLSKRYRVAETVSDWAALASKQVTAAFVHSSTESHVEIATALLAQGIHVYVDKPLAYSLAAAQPLVAQAAQSDRLLMVGFNRRFAPLYAQVQATPDRRIVIMQKNRTFSPEQARRVIFDDFIHVVDTLRFLAPGPIHERRVVVRQQAGVIEHLMLQLDGAGWSLIGLMNRDNGSIEETLEVMSPGHKWIVRDLNTLTHFDNGLEQHHTFPDWEPVLQRRGFGQIIDHFLACVRGDAVPAQSLADALVTHEICEYIASQAAEND